MRRFLIVNLLAATLAACGLALIIVSPSQLGPDGSESGGSEVDAGEFLEEWRRVWRRLLGGEEPFFATVETQAGTGTTQMRVEVHGESWAILSEFDGSVQAFYDAGATDPERAGKVLYRGENGWALAEHPEGTWLSGLGLGQEYSLLALLEAEVAVGQLTVKEVAGEQVATLEDGRQVRMGEGMIAYVADVGGFSILYEDATSGLEFPQVEDEDIIDAESVAVEPGAESIFDPAGDYFETLFALAREVSEVAFATEWGESLGELKVETAEEFAEKLQQALEEETGELVVVKAEGPAEPGEVSVAVRDSLLEEARWPKVPVAAVRSNAEDFIYCWYVTVDDRGEFQYGWGEQAETCDAGGVDLRGIRGAVPYEASPVHEADERDPGEVSQ